MGIGSIGAGTDSFRALFQATGKLNKSLDRLSSGRRINSASDDAAGLAVAEKLRAQIASLSQASRNADHGVSLAQVADSAMGSQGDMLVRMRELAVQSANGALGNEERAAIQQEFDELSQTVDQIAGGTSFNGQPLLEGGSTEIQVGTSAGSGDVVAIDTPDTSTAALEIDGADLSSADGARAALDSLDAAISSLAQSRGEVGSSVNRLRSAQNNITAEIEGTIATHSGIADADVAGEASLLALGQAQLRGGISALKQSLAIKGLMVNLMA
jgi:flagellin